MKFSFNSVQVHCPMVDSNRHIIDTHTFAYVLRPSKSTMSIHMIFCWGIACVRVSVCVCVSI